MRDYEKNPNQSRSLGGWRPTGFATLPKEKQGHPSFSSFKDWLSANGYSHYLNFRSVAGADYDAEMWFDDELGQNWRR